MELQLTPEQVVTVHAALNQAAITARDKQLHFLNLHESDKVGPVTKAEAWKTYRAWEQRENEAAQVMQAMQAAAGGREAMPFTAWGLFS
jgi:hypothetical protein